MFFLIFFFFTTFKSESPTIEPYLTIYNKEIVSASDYPLGINEFNDGIFKFSFKVLRSYYFIGLCISKLSTNIQSYDLTSMNISIGSIYDIFATQTTYIQINIQKVAMKINSLSLTLIMSNNAEIKQIYLTSSNSIKQDELIFRVPFQTKFSKIPKVQIFLNGIYFHQQYFELSILNIDQQGFAFTVYGLNIKLKFWITITYIAFEEVNNDLGQTFIITEGIIKTQPINSIKGNIYSPIQHKFYEFDQIQNDISFENSLILGIIGANFSNYTLNFQVHYLKNANQKIDFLVSGVYNESFIAQYFSIIRVSCKSSIVSIKNDIYECLPGCINNMTSVSSDKNPYNDQINVVLIQPEKKYCTCTKSQYLKDLRCYNCHHSCNTCTDSISCDTCVKNRIKKTRLCDCKAGYFEKEQSCYQCQLKCKECMGETNNDCTTCKVGFLNITNIGNQTGHCECEAGLFYFNQSCIPCHYTCRTCLGTTLFQCTSCSFTRHLTARSTCECDDGYFNLGQAAQKDYNLESIIFPLGQTFKNPDFLLEIQEQQKVLKECYKCHESCRRCIGVTQKDCTYCYGRMKVDVINQKYQTGVCICPYTEYMTSQILCKPCEVGCQRCIASTEGNCYKCLPSYNLEVLGQQNMIQLGVCRCPVGFTRNITSGECVKCHKLCQSCSGIEMNQCNTCNITEKLQLTWNNTCDCIPGYYKFQSVCSKCSQKCISCYEEPDQCNQCNENRHIPPLCNCDKGYWDDNQKCTKCWVLCKECINGDDNSCLECNYNLVKQNQTKTSKCICQKKGQQFSFVKKQCQDDLYLWSYNYFNALNSRHYINVYWSEEVYIKTGNTILKTINNPFYYYEKLMNDYRIINGINNKSRALEDMDQDISIEKVSIHFKGVNESENVQINIQYSNDEIDTFLQLMNLWIRVNISALKPCQYQVKVINQEKNMMVLEIEYYKAFSDTMVQVYFDKSNELFTQNLLILNQSQITEGFNFSFGPYHTIDETMQNHHIYQSISLNIEEINNYKNKWDIKLILAFLRYTKIVQILFPTISACITLFHISGNISIIQYNFLSLLAYTQHYNITRYSYQQNPINISSDYQNAMQQTFPQQLMNAAIQYTPPNLRKLEYFSIFLYDLDITLIVLFLLTILRIIEALQFQQRTAFFAYLQIRYVKVTFYEICLSAILQNFNSFNSIQKSLVFTLSWLSSILILIIYALIIIISIKAAVSYENIEYIIFEQIKDSNEIVKVVSILPKFKKKIILFQTQNYCYEPLIKLDLNITKQQSKQAIPYSLQQDEDELIEEEEKQLLANGLLGFTELMPMIGLEIFSENQILNVFNQLKEQQVKKQEKIETIEELKLIKFANKSFIQGMHQIPSHCFMFKFICLSKRFIAAILVALANPGNQEDILYFFLTIEIIYIAYKFIARPYLHQITFTFKVIGDLFYAFSIYATLQQEISIKKLMKEHQYCQEDAIFRDYDEWLVIASKGWQVYYALSGFIICYLIEAVIAPFLTDTEIMRVIKQVMYNPVEINSLKEKKELIDLPEQIETENELYIENLLRTYKLFNYSELVSIINLVIYGQFNWGICMDNQLMTIRWWSSMIKSDNDIDSCGVRYKICIINKSKRHWMNLQDLKFKLLEYERKEKEAISSEDKMLKPNSFKSFEEEVIMDFASLSVYEDFLTFESKVVLLDEQQNPCNIKPIEFSFKLCTSELKLLSNFKNFSFQQFKESQSLNDEMGILYQKHLNFCNDSLQIVLTEFQFICMSNSEQQEFASQEYLAKFRTNFHKYRPLEYFLEMTVRPNEQKLRIRIMVNELTRDLAMWSGYRQVLEKWGKSLVNFLKTPQQQYNEEEIIQE